MSACAGTPVWVCVSVCVCHARAYGARRLYIHRAQGAEMCVACALKLLGTEGYSEHSYNLSPFARQLEYIRRPEMEKAI